MTRNFTRSGSCDGKEAYDSARLVHAVLRRGARARGPRQAYRCDHCGFYHIGSSLKPSAKLARKRAERARYAAVASQANIALPSDFEDCT